MRDAFGGVFMMRLMLVFIVIYVAFTAISYKYAKSFRIKNSVIDFVEQNQIVDIEKFFTTANSEKLRKLDNVLTNANYKVTCKNGNGLLNNNERQIIGYCYNGVIIELNEEKTTSDSIYYNIYTYVDWNLGPLNAILALGGKKQNSEKVINGTWVISGEAKVINK